MSGRVTGKRTAAVDGNLLNRASILKEVQVDEGHFLTAGVLDNRLHTSVINLGQLDLKTRRRALSSWRRHSGGSQREECGRESSDTHSGGLERRAVGRKMKCVRY